MLKMLELFGFKSFADRTTFNFSDGITGVVGPNGSGKSNVVDAIKWILGDQSAKSLRGKEMADVIFNGAAGRKPSPLAEATLTLDNSSGYLPIESREVLVGRRLWRSGEAEYLINRSPARLKDVRDLFMGTGAGPSAYCIIEQGRVDQILQANATSRRLVFEEAAGISRFKSRRIEAERKLERVEHNLQRLTDIVDEVEAQLNSVRSQAAKAARYREIADQLRELWLGLACDEYRRFSAELENYEQSIATGNAEAEKLDNQLQVLTERLAELDTALADVDDRLREVERQRAGNRERIAGHQATIRHQAARNQELDVELVRLRKQRLIMTARLQESAAEIDETASQLEQLEADFALRTRELAARDERIRKLTDEIAAGRHAIEQSQARLQEVIRRVTDTGNRLKGLQSQRESAQSARENAETRRQDLGRQTASANLELHEAEEDVEIARKLLDQVNEKLADVRQARDAMLTEQGQFERELAGKRERRSACQARKTVLNDLEQRQEGFGIGVKEILRRARTATESPWNRILGTVADLIETDLEHAGLLEVALGDRSQLIVLDQLGPLIEYLQTGITQISSRVGFTARGTANEQSAASSKSKKKAALDRTGNGSPWIEHFRLDPSRWPDLTGRPGVRSRADRLVRSSDKAPALAACLLADTWIVETLDAALELASGDGRDCRFVTLQGELLEPDGTLMVGSVRAETALVSRKSELRQLRHELAELDREITEAERRISKMGHELSESDSDRKSLEADVKAAADRHAAAKTRVAARQAELERIARDAATLQNEIIKLDRQSEQLKAQAGSAAAELSRAEKAQQALAAEIEQAQRSISDSESKLADLQAERGERKLGLAKHEERLAGLREALGRMQRDRDQKRVHQAESDRRLQAATVKQQELALYILHANSALAEHFLHEEQFAGKAGRILKRKERIRRRRAIQLEEQNALRDRRREINEELHRTEIKIRDTRHQLTSLETRTEEEYQIALPQVVESGASAIQLYLSEQHSATRERNEGPAAASSTGGASSLQIETEDGQSGDPNSAASSSPEGKTAAAKRLADVPSHSDEREASVAGTALQGFSLPEELSARDIRYEEIRDEIEGRVKRLRRKLKLIGSVNSESLRDLDELEQRYGHLSSQLEDLVEAKRALEEIVRRINLESKRLFADAFETIRGHFRELFRKLFGGGEGDVILEDVTDILDCGIDIVARPPGKELRSISLLSGGEKTLTAVALLLAIFKSRPSPFCILDEVDAALDEANIDRFASLVREFEQSTQFIMVTHSKRTMAVADVLYGVTMEESGVSKRMSVRFEDVGENGDFELKPSAEAAYPDAQDAQSRDAA